MEEGLREFAVLIASLERRLEEAALEAWLGVLDQRVEWVKGELMLKGCVDCLELLKVTPEELLPELLKILGQTPERAFDPEAFYREAEEDAERHRAEFEAEWRLFAADWPEQATPEQRNRVVAIEQAPLLEWITETRARLAALKASGAE